MELAEAISEIVRAQDDYTRAVQARVTAEREESDAWLALCTARSKATTELSERGISPVVLP